MSRIGIALYGLGAACLVAGVVAMLHAESGDVHGMGEVGLISSAFSFAAAAGLTAKDPERLQHGTVRLPPGTTSFGEGFSEGLVIRPPRRWARGTVVLFGCFALADVLVLVLTPDAGVLVVAAGVIFGAMALVGTLMLVDNGVLVLGEDGIADVGTRRLTVLRWDDVTSVERRYGARGSFFLSLRGPVEHSAVSGPAARFIAWTYGNRMTVPLSEVRDRAGWIEDVVRRCVEDPRARREVARGAAVPA